MNPVGQGWKGVSVSLGSHDFMQQQDGAFLFAQKRLSQEGFKPNTVSDASDLRKGFSLRTVDIYILCLVYCEWLAPIQHW